ncbi:MAG: alkaline phosphatase, partial [Spirochaetota bacterium]
LSSRCVIGWTTDGHTGEDLFVYAYGPQTPRGTLENTELGRWMAAALEVDLDKTTYQLYRKADESLFGAAKVAIDMVTDPKNPAILVEKGATKAIFPVNTNHMIVGGKVTNLTGLNLIIKGKGWVGADGVKQFAALAK